MLEFDIDDARVWYLFSTIVEGAGNNHVILIETNFLKELLRHCTTRSTHGVAIRGPSGTGISTSSLYLWNKLRNLDKPVPFLVCSLQCIDDPDFNLYIQSFCEGNYYSQYNLRYFNAIL